MKKNHWIAPLPSTKVPYMYFEKKIDIKFKLISVTVLQHTMSKKYCPFLYSEYYTIKIGQDFSVIMYRVGRGRSRGLFVFSPTMCIIVARIDQFAKLRPVTPSVVTRGTYIG